MPIDPAVFSRVTIAFNVAVIAFQLLYTMTVPLQFTPTSAYLPTGNVTCYATHLPGGLADPAFTDVGGFEYTLLLLDLMRFIFPIVSLSVLGLSLALGSSGIAWAMLVVFGLFGLEELIKFVVRIDEYWFCSNWQICPRCSAPDYTRCAPEDTSCPHSYLYRWIFWSNLVWLALIILYMILMGFLAYVAQTHAENKEKAKKAFWEEFYKDDKDRGFVQAKNLVEKSLEKIKDK